VTVAFRRLLSAKTIIKYMMRLSAFIREQQEAILQEWEDFARTIEPPALTMDRKALRNHASQMLDAIAADLDTVQSPTQQADKSKGFAPPNPDDTAAETHAVARLVSGYSVEQLISEYRALRASVLRLWADASKGGLITDPVDITRFNEAIDQALSESVHRYASMVKQGQNLFLAILGHDLRNPLGATINGAEVLMARHRDDADFRAASTIFNSGRRMSKLVDDLIDYTRTHLGGGIPISPKVTDAAVLTRRLLEEMRVLHPDRIIQFTAEGKLEGLWGEGRIAQVISNLVGNALQHGEPNSPIIIKAVSDETEVLISVSNHGKPIPLERQKTMFNPLVRYADYAPPADERDTSLGIGLYIAREIALAHGGTIQVGSFSDLTTFTLRLPRIPSLSQ
jgi:signal transduction histidine kinase